MHSRASLLLVLFFSVLLVQPGACARTRFTVHEEIQDQAGEPVSFTISTVAAVGSLYSVYKTTKLMQQERHEFNTATELIAEHAKRLSMGCALIDQVDHMLDAQRQSLQSVSQAQKKELVITCNDNDRIEQSANYLAAETSQVCEGLAPELSDGKLSCDNLSADLRSGGLEKACALADRKKRDALSHRLDVDRARLNGLKAGLLCPDYEGPDSSTGFLEQRAVASSGSIVDTISLLYSILGSADFGLDLVDTVVNTNRGFAASFDFAENNVRTVQALMCKSFSKFWVQMIMAHTVTLSALFDQYYSLSRLQPPASLGMMWPGDGWPLDTAHPAPKMSKGSTWVCHNEKRCLVPAGPYMSERSRAGGVGDHNPDVGDCAAKERDQFLLCGQGEEVTLMLPTACFHTFFATKQRVTPSLEIEGSAYIHTYGQKNKYGRAAGGMKLPSLDWEQCLQPLEQMYNVVRKSREKLEEVRDMMMEVCE